MRANTIRRLTAAAFALGLIVGFAELRGRTTSMVDVHPILIRVKR